MPITAFPSPPDLEVDFVNRIGDSQPKSFNMYGPANPHPGFGKDPDILNEYGHSAYPKMVYPQGKNAPGVAVNNAEEEHAALNPEPEEYVEKVQPQGNW